MLGDDSPVRQRPRLAFDRHNAIDEHERFIGQAHTSRKCVDRGPIGAEHWSNLSDGKFQALRPIEKNSRLHFASRVVDRNETVGHLHESLKNRALKSQRSFHRPMRCGGHSQERFVRFRHCPHHGRDAATRVREGDAAPVLDGYSSELAAAAFQSPSDRPVACDTFSFCRPDASGVNRTDSRSPRTTVAHRSCSVTRHAFTSDAIEAAAPASPMSSAASTASDEPIPAVDHGINCSAIALGIVESH